MRSCIITKDKFTPKNPDHFFSSVDAFEKFISLQDPMDTFQPKKRSITWTPQERIDPKTGKKFMAEHPAQVYKPSDEPQEPKRTNPNENFEAVEERCHKCERLYIRTKPAMKYCNECSEYGGHLVK